MRQDLLFKVYDKDNNLIEEVYSETIKDMFVMTNPFNQTYDQTKEYIDDSEICDLIEDYMTSKYNDYMENQDNYIISVNKEEQELRERNIISRAIDTILSLKNNVNEDWLQEEYNRLWEE